MQSQNIISTPALAGDSLLNSHTTPAPCRRGRPRKHFASEGRSAESARKAAYRARLRKKRERGKKRKMQRDISQLLKAQGIVRWKRDKYGSFRGVALTSSELKLTNKILAAQGLGVSKGQFLTDAPTGRGELVSGGYGGEKISFINGKRGKENIALADDSIAPLHSGR